MERFVFIAAVTIAIIFGVGAVFGGGGQHFGWNWDMDVEAGTAPVVEVAPGSMAAQTFQGEILRIKNTAANVTIITEDRQDFSVEIENSAGRAPMPTVAAEGDRVIIDGQLRGRIEDCEDGGGASLRGYGDVSAEELPRITIHAPRALSVERGGAGSTQVGATESLSFDFGGCGTATLADVAGELNLDLAGSGAITAGAARHLAADIAGSGELTLGAITEGADIDIAGSGTVTMASLIGDLSTDAAGSGTVEVRGGSVGTASIDMAGSGEISIAAPVQTLNVSIMGTGDVDVAGVVGDLDAEIAGTGTVSAQSVTGSMRQDIAGPGNVRIGGAEPRAGTP